MSGAAPERSHKPRDRRRTVVIGANELRRRRYEARRDEITHEAIHGLALRRPDESAKHLLSRPQAVVFGLLIAGVLGFALMAPLTAFVTLNAVASLYFISALVFRIRLLSLGWRARIGAPATSQGDDDALPVVTILLPLYRDKEALPMLAHAVDRLDYPVSKKDVKLLLEEDDSGTIHEAYRLGLDRRYDLILIPPRAPRTKPKACNYGLYLALGELIVIYDAEDQPEPDQLRKAAEAFERGAPHLACVQARLNYYNRNDNWLTRLFTLEYSLWFDWLLPGLQRMGAPIPLGGTSNIFRTESLRAVGGWDPYNVTEDADLGLRLARSGYAVEVLDSTTFEEANCRLDNWMRQRSRWMKGYLQTWLVHMRRPRRIIETTGWKGFWAVQLFVAGNLFSAVINPVMWLAFAVWLWLGPNAPADFFPEPLLYVNFIALSLGNLFFIALMALGPLKRGWRGLAAYAVTAPAYWLLTSLAAYKALAQAISRPHYWEKTAHVISDAAKQKRQCALKALSESKRSGTTSHDQPASRAEPSSVPACGQGVSEDERPRQ